MYQAALPADRAADSAASASHIPSESSSASAMVAMDDARRPLSSRTETVRLQQDFANIFEEMEDVKRRRSIAYNNMQLEASRARQAQTEVEELRSRAEEIICAARDEWDMLEAEQQAAKIECQLLVATQQSREQAQSMAATIGEEERHVYAATKSASAAAKLELELVASSLKSFARWQVEFQHSEQKATYCNGELEDARRSSAIERIQADEAGRHQMTALRKRLQGTDADLARTTCEVESVTEEFLQLRDVQAREHQATLSCRAKVRARQMEASSATTQAQHIERDARRLASDCEAEAEAARSNEAAAIRHVEIERAAVLRAQGQLQGSRVEWMIMQEEVDAETQAMDTAKFSLAADPHRIRAAAQNMSAEVWSLSRELASAERAVGYSQPLKRLPKASSFCSIGGLVPQAAKPVHKQPRVLLDETRAEAQARTVSLSQAVQHLQQLRTDYQNAEADPRVKRWMREDLASLEGEVSGLRIRVRRCVELHDEWRSRAQEWGAAATQDPVNRGSFSKS